VRLAGSREGGVVVKDEIQKVLEKPFPEDLVRSRQGPHGRALVYVEAVQYIKRLNEAFDLEWGFEVMEHHVYDDEVVVLARITACGVSKSAFGSSAITRVRGSTDPVSVGDDFKSACSDALKKAAGLFGVGLELYLKENGKPNHETVDQDVVLDHEVDSESRTATNGETGKQAVAARKNPLTQRQLNAMLSLSTRLGWSDDVLDKFCLQSWGTRLKDLDRRSASDLISELSRRIDCKPNQASAAM